MPFAALRTGHAGVFRFFQRLDVFAFRIIGAADEFAAGTAVFEHELSAAFGAAASGQFGLRLRVAFHALGSLLGGFVGIARVIAFGIACTGDEAAGFAEFDLQLVLAAFGAGFVQFLRGEFGALDAFFFFNLLVEAFPEFVHHGHPRAFAVGDFVQLVFQFRGEIVVHILLEMLGEEFIDDVARVGGLEAALFHNHIFAVFQRFDDAGVCGRAADAVFFQCLHQGRFVEARRRLGEVLFAIKFVHGQHVARRHFGQFFRVFALVVFVLAFLVNA